MAREKKTKDSKGQILVIVNEYTVVLLCDKDYWYQIKEYYLGECWCGKDVELYDSMNDANDYIEQKGLIKFSGYEIE